MPTILEQQLSEEEKKLERDLARIYKDVKRDLSIKLKGQPLSWTEIQRDYKTRADQSIRSAVAEMYHAAAKRTVETKIKVPFFLTDMDMQEIRRLTAKYQDDFWISFYRDITDKTSKAYDPQSNLFSLPQYIRSLKGTFIGRIVESINADVSANAVISKSRQVLLDQQRANLLRFGNSERQQRTIESKRRGAKSPVLYRSAALANRNNKPRFIWKSEHDGKVCDLCEPLNGRVFDVDDPLIMTPVVDTHPRCRCELALEDGEIGVDTTGSLDFLQPTFINSLF